MQAADLIYTCDIPADLAIRKAELQSSAFF